MKARWILVAVFLLIVYMSSTYKDRVSPEEQVQSNRVVLEYNCRGLRIKAVGSMSPDDFTEINRCRIAGLWKKES
jgi:hypothetical protein